ncbi:MAG TPA: hypothetical protein VHH88_10265 [Verrucomicrobiae bacterium]|nr:hypothetical protein [Verrucomicrobiae bacterium]
MTTNDLPAYIIALFTAIWFGLMAWRFGHNPILWAVAGILLALVVGTSCIGLANTVTLPYTVAAMKTYRWYGTGATVLVVAIIGGITWFAQTRPRAATRKTASN